MNQIFNKVLSWLCISLGLLLVIGSICIYFRHDSISKNMSEANKETSHVSEQLKQDMVPENQIPGLIRIHKYCIFSDLENRDALNTSFRILLGTNLITLGFILKLWRKIS